MKTRKLVIAKALGLALLLAGPAWAQTEDIYVSASGSGTAGSVSFDDEDIVLCDRSGGVGTCIWSMFFDGSAAGLGTPVDTSAFHVMDDDNILMSFQTPKKIGNLKKVDDSDIVHYDRTVGPKGTFEFYFDGSEVGLTTDDESIDAIGFTPTGGGRLVISTDGDYSVPMTGGGTLSGGDEDLIVFNGTTGSGGTSGDWQLFFDGSDVGLNSPQEDIGGAWIDDVTDELYLTTRGAFSLGSVTGGGTDIFVCDPLDFDPTTACATVSGFFFAADEDYEDKIIDGLFIVNNSPPIAVDDFFTTDEDTAIVGENVLAANPTTPDSDPDGDPLTVTEVDGNPANVGIEITLASGALLTVLADGSMTYDPNGQFEELGEGQTAEDGFEYTIDDGNGGTDSATVTITIIGVDDPPVAVDDMATLTEDDPATLIDVLANDTDVDGGPKTVDSVSDPAGGTVVNFGTHVTYEPDPDFCNDGTPTDDFTYTLNGGSSATVFVTVICVDDPPVAVDDMATLTEDDPATLIDVLANDTDVDGGPKTVDSVSDPAGGTVVNFGTHVTYEPDPDFCNDGTPTDDFTYTLNGGSSATVFVTVICVDDPPVAVDDMATLTEDDPATLIDVLANDTDVDGGPKTVDSVSDPAGGTVVNFGTHVTYEPDPDFCNDGTPTDDFTYTLNGGSSATVFVTVICVNDPPVAVDDMATLTEDDPATLIDVLANDTDVDGGPKTVDSVSDPAGGTVVNFGTHVTYEPDPDFCNDGTPTDDFTYTLNGGSSATVFVTVICVDDPPVAVDDMATLTEDDPATLIDVLANDTDVDGGPKTVDSVSDPAGGTVVNFGTHVTYEPDPDFCNDGTPTDDFTYTLNGGSSATVFVTVICVPEPPVVTPPGPFDVTGNVRIQVPDGADDLLSNVGGDGPFTISSASATSLNSTVVNVFINTTTGAFSYDPPVGHEGTDQFDYEVCGPGGCDTATVNLNVSDMIWFIDDSAAGGGDGRLTSPFNCLSGAGCFDPTALDAIGDSIFLDDGSYTGGLTLLDNQRLIGDGASSDLASITGITLPPYSDSLPVFSGIDPVVTGAANGINLASGNTVRGISIGDVSGTAIRGTTVGSLTITETSIGDATPSGGGIEVTTSGTLSVTLDSLSASSGTDAGINLNGVSGTFSITDVSGTIATTGVRAINIDGNPSLGLNATFASVSANGGSNGISLTDVTGSFTVTGDGSTPASGGTIQNTAIGIRLDHAENISFNWVQVNDHSDFAFRGFEVDNFTLSDSVVDGVNGDSAAADEGSIRFDNLTGTASFAGNTIEGGHEDNIRIDNNVDKVIATLNMTVEDSASNPMVIGLNNTTFGNDGILLETSLDAMAELTVSGVDFDGARGDMVQTNALGDSIQIVTIENSTFDNTHPNIVSGGGGITLSGGSATSDINVDYSVTGSIFSGAEGNAITANFLSNLGLVTGVIQNNTIGTGVAGSGSLGGSGIFAGAEKNGAISGGDLIHTVLIDNNTIRGIDGFAGITIGSNRGDASNRAEVNATITDNDVAGLGGFALAAMYMLTGGSAVSGDFAHVCALVQDNVALDASSGPSAGNAVFFDQISADANYNLPGYTGSPNGEFNAGTASFDIDAYLSGLSNSMTNGPFPSFPGGVDAGLVLGVTGGASCPTP